MKMHQKTFGMLLLAYLISMLYQYYRFTLQEHPADTFGVKEVVGYALLLVWSSLALIQKEWAIKAVLSLCVVQLAIGFFYYFPVIFRNRHDYFWDWAEGIVFILLIFWAGYNSVTQLAAAKKDYKYQKVL